ncbi:MAG: HAD family phosphatase [Clostridium sp.]|nr:HAD family phosphatase [Clostridium sp.]
MKFEAAIFDLDGTLLDSMGVWEQIDIAFLQKRNLSMPEGYAAKLSSLSFEEAARYTIALFHLDEKAEDIMREWRDMAAYEYAHHVGMLPYALEYLLRLKAAGVRLAVATGMTISLAVPCLKNNAIFDLFDAVCSTDEVPRGKEYPDIFAYTAHKLGVPPENCLVFDDVLPAIRSAKQANMLTCGVYDFYSKQNRAEMEALADYYLSDWRDAPMPNKKQLRERHGYGYGKKDQRSKEQQRHDHRSVLVEDAGKGH